MAFKKIRNIVILKQQNYKLRKDGIHSSNKRKKDEKPFQQLMDILDMTMYSFFLMQRKVNGFTFCIKI